MMEYDKGAVARVFYIRFDHGDDLFEELTHLVRREKVRNGWFQIFGGLGGAEVVIGPKEPVMPPEPVWSRTQETREIIGSGTVLWDKDRPAVHLHAAMGHHGDTLTACVRKRAEVYLVVEAVLFELSGMQISRPWYEKGGFNRPEFVGK
jgi:predicted DNA-binding protein with PD1-like motif